MATTTQPEPRTRTEQMLLPFAEKEYIDVNRTARILGIAPRRVLELIAEGIIASIDYAPRRSKRVHYKSLVEMCNRLRARYSIPDRRSPVLSDFLRHDDKDLLPFPLDETIYAKEASVLLGFSSVRSIHYMCEEGSFEAYQLTKESEWRISRPSLAAFIGRARERTKG